MRRLLDRISITSRLLICAAAITGVLVAVDYVTLRDLPDRVAADSVEIALRENTQSFNAALADERDALRAKVDQLLEGDNSAVRQAIFARDLDTLHAATSRLGKDVGVEFVDPDDPPRAEVGVVAVQRSLSFRSGIRTVVFYRQIDAGVLDRAAADAGGLAEFAVERSGEFIARSQGYARSIAPEDVNPSDETTTGSFRPIELRDERRHVYVRRLSQESAYQVHALSTDELEDEAHGASHADVRNAIIGMTLATLLGTLLIALLTGRTVRSFAGRVRELAGGDYRRRLPVLGHDGFAVLASSVNQLSSDLDAHVGKLEAVATEFQATLDTLDTGICRWTTEGDVAFWSRGAEQLTGLQRERVTGDSSVPRSRSSSCCARSACPVCGASTCRCAGRAQAFPSISRSPRCRTGACCRP